MSRTRLGINVAVFGDMTIDVDAAAPPRIAREAQTRPSPSESDERWSEIARAVGVLGEPPRSPDLRLSDSRPETDDSTDEEQRENSLRPEAQQNARDRIERRDVTPGLVAVGDAPTVGGVATSPAIATGLPDVEADAGSPQHPDAATEVDADALDFVYDQAWRSFRKAAPSSSPPPRNFAPKTAAVATPEVPTELDRRVEGNPPPVQEGPEGLTFEHPDPILDVPEPQKVERLPASVLKGLADAMGSAITATAEVSTPSPTTSHSGSTQASASSTFAALEARAQAILGAPRATRISASGIDMDVEIKLQRGPQGVHVVLEPSQSQHADRIAQSLGVIRALLDRRGISTHRVSVNRNRVREPVPPEQPNVERQEPDVQATYTRRAI